MIMLMMMMNHGATSDTELTTVCRRTIQSNTSVIVFRRDVARCRGRRSNSRRRRRRSSVAGDFRHVCHRRRPLTGHVRRRMVVGVVCGVNVLAAATDTHSHIRNPIQSNPIFIVKTQLTHPYHTSQHHPYHHSQENTLRHDTIRQKSLTWTK